MTLTTLEQRILVSITSDDFEQFKNLVQRSSGLWKKIRTIKSGNTLMQQLIKWGKLQFFRYLLSISDVKYLEERNDEGQTAITCTMAIDYTFRLPYVYVTELLTKYEVLPSHYHEEYLLTWSIGEIPNSVDDYMPYLVLVESLLKKGLNPNSRPTDDEPTALHSAVLSEPFPEAFRLILLLLIYNADPFLTLHGCNAFEWSVLHNQEDSVCELLLEYTIDHLKTHQINFLVLLELADRRSPLFDRLVEYGVKCVVQFIPVQSTNVEILLNLETRYLEILLEKYFHAVRVSFSQSAASWTTYPRRIDDRILERMSLIVRSGASTMKCLVHSVIPVIYDCYFKSYYFFQMIVRLGETAATQIITLLPQYNVQIPIAVYDLVYRSFGYCKLFRYLLHIDYVGSRDRSLVRMPVFMVSLHCYVHLDLEHHLETPFLFGDDKLEDVLDFFAHWKVRSFLLQKIENLTYDMQEKILKRLEHHPDVPSLVELARDASRKHIVRRYEVSSNTQFYSLVGNLHIHLVYKRIICLERKIYIYRE